MTVFHWGRVFGCQRPENNLGNLVGTMGCFPHEVFPHQEFEWLRLKFSQHKSRQLWSTSSPTRTVGEEVILASGNSLTFDGGKPGSAPGSNRHSEEENKN